MLGDLRANILREMCRQLIVLVAFCLYICLFQAIKQMYVLLLGLDVLGNPFGLITGLKDGAVDFFYEPYQVWRPIRIYVFFPVACVAFSAAQRILK